MKLFKIISSTSFVFLIIFFYSVVSIDAQNAIKTKSIINGKEVLGRKIYIQNGCFVCHGEHRLGRSAPPLIPQFIGRFRYGKLKSVITKGLFPIPMPAFKQLSGKNLSALISYLRKRKPSSQLGWTEKNIKTSLIKYANENIRGIKPVNVKNLIAVVEGGTGKVWIIKGTKILNKFNFGNIHGGLKYSPAGRYLYLPSNTGYVGKYDFYSGRLVYKVRACRYLRNISLSEGGKYVLAACRLPKEIVVLNSKNLKPERIIPLKHGISVIYGLFRNNKAVFSFMHKPYIGILNTDTLSLSYYKIPVPFQDFFVDPLDEYAVGGSFNKGELYVFSLKDKKIVWRHGSNGIPHPAGAGFWFHNGRFYFALTSLNAPYVSVWRMYSWKFIKNVYTGGSGFFVKTNPYTKYLWVDDSSDKEVLINKYNFHTKKLAIKHSGLVIHTQFSGSEKLAYISLYGTTGELAVVNANSLKVIKTIPADDVIGKYNYVNYQRMNDAALLGEEVYFTYCWGCHNPTLRSIGPSFSYIASHLNDFGIKEQLADPQAFSKKLGYKYNTMPKFNLSRNEIKALIAFIKDSGNRNFWRNGN